MTTPSRTEEQTIRAKVDPGAVSRMAELFSARTTQVINEVLQNARRSGASKVELRTSPAGTLTITDDGCGIAEPAILLAFGESGWNRTITLGEKAAGMGLYALARCRPTIRSRTAANQDHGWETVLDEPHFRGSEAARVFPSEAAPRPHGTTVVLPGLRAGPGDHAPVDGHPPLRARAAGAVLSARGRPRRRTDRQRSGLPRRLPLRPHLEGTADRRLDVVQRPQRASQLPRNPDPGDRATARQHPRRTGMARARRRAVRRPPGADAPDPQRDPARARRPTRHATRPGRPSTGLSRTPPSTRRSTSRGRTGPTPATQGTTCRQPRPRSPSGRRTPNGRSSGRRVR